MDEPRERTPEEMRAYLDEHNQTMVWLAAEHEQNQEGDWEKWASERRAGILDEPAIQAYIVEHLEVCAWCSQTREWHNLNPVRDHLFDPNERVPIEG